MVMFSGVLAITHKADYYQLVKSFQLNRLHECDKLELWATSLIRRRWRSYVGVSRKLRIVLSASSVKTRFYGACATVNFQKKP